MPLMRTDRAHIHGPPVAHPLDREWGGQSVSPADRKKPCADTGEREPSTVRHAAASACPIV